MAALQTLKNLGGGGKIMSMLIQHNLAAMNAQRQFNTVTKSKNKKAERLSSGYRINRAADDAAGLSISEKMRRQIRGLRVGTENAEMGISWVQIGEGALNEAHDILQRMNELSIKAQNGTNTLVDRAYMEAEFEQLQSELDRISTTTTFNELNIFEEHEPVYDQISGNIQWDYEEYHDIVDGRNNELTITYRESAESEAQVMTIKVPPGRYTTHELMDEIDDAFGIDSPIHMEFTEKGFCRLNLEGGEVMDSVTGGLSYLLWDTYDGGGYGALIGTTAFEKATDKLEIVKGQNDYMKFQMEYFDKDVVEAVEINLFDAAALIPSVSQPVNTANGPTLKLTKEDLMTIIDNWLDVNYHDCGLKTSHHGDSIQLSSDLGIVTGFKGNMFKIENKDPIFTSVFYDNIQQGYVWQDPASVVGGAVLTTDSRDQEHNRYYIDDTNNKLVLQPNLTAAPVEIEITVKKTDSKVPGSDPTKPDFDPTTLGYTAQEMVDELNKQFKAKGIDGEVKAHLVQSKKRDPYPDKKNPGGAATPESVGDDSLIFEGIEIRTVKEGPDAIVNINRKESTAYDTLFTIKNYNMYGTGAADATINNEDKVDVNAYAVGTKTHTGNVVINKNNNKFTITLRSTPNRDKDFNYEDIYGTKVPTDYEKTYTVTLDAGTRNIANTVSHINAKLGTIKIGTDAAGKDIFLNSRIKAVNDGGKIKIQDNEDLILNNVDDKSLNWYTEIELGSSGGNNGYQYLFQQSYKYTVPKTVSGKGKLTLTGPATGGPLTITVNGQSYDYYVNGKMTATQIRDMINKDTPIEFSDADGKGETKAEGFTVKGDGTRTIPYYAGEFAQGDSEKHQGKAGYKTNTPAEAEIGPSIPTTVVVDDSCNEITISLNGKRKTLTLENSKRADGSFSAFDTNKDGKYSQAELVEALQQAIDDAFGTDMGGALVSIKSNRLILTSRLPSDEDGKNTSIETYAQGQAVNTFFDSLHDTETAASCTSTKALQANITLTDGDNDKFTFSYTDEQGKSYNVELDLLDSTEVDGTSVPPYSKKFTRGELVQRIKDKIAADSVHAGKVSAKADGSNRLVLTTTGTGEKTHIEYTTGPNGNASKNATALFGNLDNAIQTTAQITLDKNAKKSVSYSGSLTFRVRIDNTWRTVNINGGWTSTTNLQNKLNNGPNGNDGLKQWGVTATVDANGKITLKKDTPGSGNLHMDYGNGGTVMEKMFGTAKKAEIPGVTVSVNPSNTAQLVITGGKNDIISVTSTTSAGMVKGTEKTGYYTHDTEEGFHSPKYSTVTSADLSKYAAGGIELDKWNNQLEFLFTEDNGKNEKKVSFRLTESGTGNKTSLADIKNELQTKIDAALGKDKVEVLLDKNRLIFKSVKPGAQFQFSGMDSKRTDTAGNLDKYKMGGGFFHHVMCQYRTEESKLADRTDVNGDQFAGDIFAQGRHDVKFDRTKLKPGVSDTLEMDLTFVEDADHNGTLDDAEKANEKKITLTLHLDTKEHDWESFGRDELLANFRKALNAAIEDPETQKEAEKLGIELHKGLIEVDIGRHNTNIWGNMDDVSLSFTITKNPDIATPVEGYFYIDGIRGNAAYESFYYTEGELIPAFITGTKDISGGVTLGKDDNELVLLVDGKMEKVDLSDLEKGKKYSAEDFVQTLTNKFKEQGLELAASITQKGALKISYKKMGRHTIEQVTGSARNELFFEEHAKKRPHLEREIRVSSNEGDRISVYSPRFSTAMLNINSICISTVENAEKATNRLKDAIKKVADMRTTFGVIQNRIEHTINNNRNKEENTQAAESRIRDADISQEMMEYSGLNIIQQAGQAILAQANQSRQGMLSLLQ